MSEKDYAGFNIDNKKTKINEDIRYSFYENWKTNDVHNVHIIGLAYDDDGNKYYKIKDSAPKNE